MQYRDRVRLDRYAIKDPEKTPEIGDMVVASFERVFERDGRTVESREVGRIETVHEDDTYDVLLDGMDANDPKSLISGLPKHKVEVVLEKSYKDICQRIAAAVAAAPEEKKLSDEDREVFKKTIEQLITEEKFVPSGRILAGLGRENYDLTLFNCYVFSIENDSRSGIAKHWGRLFETYSRGGGIGWNISVLRPRGAVVKKVNGKSSGSVSWAEQFSQITGVVEQGGSRRGAALMGLEVWHPDILEFISVKSKREDLKTPDGVVISRNMNLLKNANISILISNDFMAAVEDDSMWQLVFPDLADPDYDKLWNGDITAWKEQHKKEVKVYTTIRARDLWNMIITHAWGSGEPGLLFIDRANEMSNSYYFDRLLCTNPCGEIFLGADGVCNLAHINLAKFVLPRGQYPNYTRDEISASLEVDWDGIAEAVNTGVRFLDNIIDLNKYHEEKIKEKQEAERRIGLGILGYGEMLIRLGLRYGSTEAQKFTDKLMQHISKHSYLASANLAEHRGSFPAFKQKKFLESGFVQNHLDSVKAAIRKHGMRNVTCNTIAPTGSVAALMNTSTGCEPFFDLSYTSTTRIGIVKEKASVAENLTDIFGDDTEKWPDYVVTAQKGITPEQHVMIQATMQRWIDSSISKTINLPNTATIEDVSKAYRLMWRMGCKGGTVYRDGSRDEQVLYADQSTDEVEVTIDEDGDYTNGILRPRPSVGLAPEFSEESPVGTVHVSIRHDPVSGDPVDMFVKTGKGNTHADAQALGRLISMVLRWPNSRYISQQTRLELIRDQLVDILGPGQVGFGPSAIRSLPDAIGKVLIKYLSGDFPLAQMPFGQAQLEDMKQKCLSAATREELAEIFDTIISNKKEEPHQTNQEEYRIQVIEATEKAEKEGMSLPIDYCPECTAFDFVKIPGKCPVCRTCGFTHC